MPEFVSRALKNAAVVKAASLEITGAEIRAKQTAAQRVLPKFDITTNHGLVPGIRTDSSRSRAFLDPNLENDWSKWGIFTRVEVQALQPLFTWGALNKAVKAANEAVSASAEAFAFKKADLALRVVEVYQARLLDQRLRGVLRNASEQFDKAEKTLQKMQDDGEDVEQGELYKFKISRYQFQQKKVEFEEQMASIRRIWDLMAGSEPETTIYLPSEVGFPVLADTIQSYEYYRDQAFSNRNDLKSVGYLKRAASSAYEARRAQRLPALFFGFGGEFVNSPRPVQQQPLLGNRYTYANLYYSIGFRQSLNFGVMKYDVSRAQLDLKKASESEAALKELIQMEVSEQFRFAIVLKQKSKTAADALQLSKEWVRIEQIDYDLGVGELRNLVDAVKSNLELDADAAKLQFDFNVEYAKLLKTAGVLNTFLNID